MASSRRWSPADAVGPPVGGRHDGAARVTAAVGRALTAHVPNGSTLAIGLSGGRDSVALLDATLACARGRALDIVAVHVHHGLSPHAGDWARFCAELCGARNVRSLERRVDVPRLPRTSIEAAARRVRYAALAEAASAVNARGLLLAHHQDDQAETVLLQLLRGAGPQGLAAMPPSRVDAGGLLWLRPLLDVPRSAIDAYLHARGLAWIDDDSNIDSRFARNALRAHVIPALASVGGGYPATIARASLHQAEAAQLADDMALRDATDAFDGATLSRSALVELPAYRARNLLRWFLRERGLAAASMARLDAMHRQLCHARADARVALQHAGAEVGIHRGRIVVHRPAPMPFERGWHGEAAVALPHGTLRFERCAGGSRNAARLGANVVIRSRRGGERLQLAINRPRQALKSLLQQADVPVWTRRGLPLVFCGDALACVPGIGVDRRFAAPPGEAAYEVIWNEN